MKRRLLISGLILILIVVVGLFLLISPVDMRHYQSLPYYQKTLTEIDSVFETQAFSIGDSIKVGWAKSSLIPPFQTPMAGYGDREGALFQSMQDSLWIKVFVLDNGITQSVLLASDLLIIPTAVSAQLQIRLSEVGLPFNQVFLTASHTHCSLGAFQPGYTGEAFAGPYNPKVVDFITEQILRAISSAQKELIPARIGRGEIAAPEQVKNRLVGEKGELDPFIRALRFSRDDGQEGLFLTYAAHATCYSAEFMALSGDYPGEWTRQLEALPNLDFVAFAAGAVGSHGPALEHIKSDKKQVQQLVNGLMEKTLPLLDSIPMTYSRRLHSFQIPIYLRRPHLRVSQDFRLRPFWFRQLVGAFPAWISVMQIEDLVLIGTPCDYSGELVNDLQSDRHSVMLTSFNGGYIGYVTEDKWYSLNEYETRTMNWFGPYNGAFFTEIIQQTLDRLP